jgi:hypothetical protein
MTAGDVLRALQAAHDEDRATGVELEGVRTVPGSAVRAVAAVLGLLVPVAAGFATMRGPVATVADALAVLLVLLVLVRPRTGWGAWLLVLAALRLLLGGALPAWQLALLLLVVHAAVLATLLAARVEPRTRVELAVPATMLRRAWPLQLGAQVAGLLVWLVGPGRALPGAEVWRVLALVGVVVLLVVVLPAGRRDRDG